MCSEALGPDLKLHGTSPRMDDLVTHLNQWETVTVSMLLVLLFIYAYRHNMGARLRGSIPDPDKQKDGPKKLRQQQNLISYCFLSLVLH